MEKLHDFFLYNMCTYNNIIHTKVFMAYTIIQRKKIVQESVHYTYKS
jgi:hypothetical protein